MIGSIVINGDVWRVLRVNEGDPALIDRTGSPRVATTDPATMCVYVSESVKGSFLDTVLLHEAGHCALVSYGMLEGLHRGIPRESWVFVEEWACNLLANHSREVLAAVNKALRRAPCLI